RNGGIVYQWLFDEDARSSQDAFLYPNGDLLVISWTGRKSVVSKSLLKLDKNSSLVWKYTERTHHKVNVDEHGTIFALIERIDDTKPEGAEFFNTPFLHDYIVALSPDGKEQYRIPIVEAFLHSPYK